MATKNFTNILYRINGDLVLSMSTWESGHFAKASIAVLDEFNQFVGEVVEITRVGKTFSAMKKAEEDVRYAMVTYANQRVAEILGEPCPARFFRDNVITRTSRPDAALQQQMETEAAYYRARWQEKIAGMTQIEREREYRKAIQNANWDFRAAMQFPENNYWASHAAIEYRIAADYRKSLGYR